MYSYLKDEKKLQLVKVPNFYCTEFLTQGKELLSSILEHPLKTAALIGGTTLGLWLFHLSESQQSRWRWNFLPQVLPQYH